MCKERLPSIPTASCGEPSSLTACRGVVPHGRYSLRADAFIISVSQHP